MKEMIEIYHENLLLGPSYGLDGKSIHQANSVTSYLKDELSSNTNAEGSEKVKLSKKDPSFIDRMELPVNNFLKTLKEIEAEFCHSLNSIKMAFNEIPDNLDSFARIMKKAEAFIYLIPQLELSGYMEENY